MKLIFKNFLRQSPYLIVGTFSIITVAIAFLCGVLGLKELTLALLPLIGTLFGATFSFRLAESKDAEKRKSEQLNALNRASFILIRQFNALSQLKIEIQNYPSQFELAFNLPALTPPAYADLAHNFETLEFILNSDPDMVLRLTIEQERFQQALESLRVRNDFYVKELQPMIAQKQLSGKLNLISMHEALGDRLFEGATRGANEAKKHIFDSVNSLASMHADLIAFSKKQYPGHKFLQMEQTQPASSEGNS